MHGVTVYGPSGHAVIDVRFNRKWQARLFHWLLNKSSSGHMGRRNY